MEDSKNQVFSSPLPVSLDTPSSSTDTNQNGNTSNSSSSSSDSDISVPDKGGGFDEEAGFYDSTPGVSVVDVDGGMTELKEVTRDDEKIEGSNGVVVQGVSIEGADDDKPESLEVGADGGGVKFSPGGKDFVSVLLGNNSIDENVDARAENDTGLNKEGGREESPEKKMGESLNGGEEFVSSHVVEGVPIQTDVPDVTHKSKEVEVGADEGGLNFTSRGGDPTDFGKKQEDKHGVNVAESKGMEENDFCFKKEYFSLSDGFNQTNHHIVEENAVGLKVVEIDYVPDEKSQPVAVYNVVEPVATDTKLVDVNAALDEKSESVVDNSVVEVAAVDSKVVEVDAALDGRSEPVEDHDGVVGKSVGSEVNEADAARDEKPEPVTDHDATTPGLESVIVAEDGMKNSNFEEHVFFALADVNAPKGEVENQKDQEKEIKQEADSEHPEQNATAVKLAVEGEAGFSMDVIGGGKDDAHQATDSVPESTHMAYLQESRNIEADFANVDGTDSGFEDGLSEKIHLPHLAAEQCSNTTAKEILEAEHEIQSHTDGEVDPEGLDSVSHGDIDDMNFGTSEAAKQFIEELKRGSGGGSHSGAESSHGHSQRIDGQIVTDSDEEVDTDDEGDGKELFDSAALAALLKAATGVESGDGSIKITSQDGSRLFSVEHPAGWGSSLRSLRPAPMPIRPNIFTSGRVSGGESSDNLSEKDMKKLEKLQQISVKFFRLIHRLGLSPDESIAVKVLHGLTLIAGRASGQLFSLDAAKKTALQLESEGKDDLKFSVNILILGKSGVGKSATINSIFGDERALIDAFEPATHSVKEITGVVDGVTVKIFDTPGLRSSFMEQALNRDVLSSVKKATKRTPVDIALYVDRLDAQTRDLNDLPLLRTITNSLGSSIWKNAIITLTHAACAPPDGPTGSPLSYDLFIAQRSHVVQQSIVQAFGDLHRMGMMGPSANPVSLVENHPSCRKNREGQKILPNGQSWRPQLLLLCYSMKILSEAGALSKPQEPFDHRKLFGFGVRSPPLPYMLSSMLQSRAHPKLSTEQGGDNGDSDIDLDDLSDLEYDDDEDEYDKLPPFKPLRKAQHAKLTREQRKAYFEEYDYRVKLLQKKQWREELKRLREMKKKGSDTTNEYGYMEEGADSGAPPPVAVPLPDLSLPPTFDGDNPAYRYRFLEPTSQFLARAVLDTHGWDHDCGYDGVNLEQSVAIASRFPAVVTVQITKDKKDFNINLDSSVAAKYGEKGSSMAGFDIQTIGKRLAYVIRGETKFKNLKKNKTGAGVALTFLGENVVTGFKIEEQITLGKQYFLVGSAGAVRSQQETAYGANFELQRRELDYPIGQIQSTFGISIIKWRGDLALAFNSLAQFSVGRSSKVAVRAGLNNKLSGQVTVKTSSSELLSLALAGIIPSAIAIYKKVYPGVGEKFSVY